MVPLLGKRKIWGTRNRCNVRTVSNAIFQKTSLADNDVTIKRKFSKSSGKVTRWWYVVSGAEATLNTLENQWDCVKQQFGWSVLPCLTFADTSPNSESHQGGPAVCATRPFPDNDSDKSATDSIQPTVQKPCPTIPTPTSSSPSSSDAEAVSVPTVSDLPHQSPTEKSPSGPPSGPKDNV